MYPQIQPGAVASDRIFVVEDTDHDGKADRSTVFADDLLLPDTVAPVERVDGKFEAYVGASTDLLLLSDTDGDGKADTRRAVLSGFGTEDTHHTIHTLYWGRDGRLSFNQSIYIHTHLETPWGVVRLNSGGSFAYDTASERVEILMRGLCNSWGHQMDAEGQSFFTDGCGGGGLTWGLRGGAFNNYENAKSIAPSVSKGGYPKFCGLELVQSPLFPADWQGDAITCDFRAHRMVRMNINRLEGKSGFVTNDEQDLLKTADAWFRPIDVKHGPDGALYLVDWTNPVINHGEVDFRDERRDHVHGRIWRMAPTASKPLPWKPMHGRTVLELCQALLSDNKWESESARRVLASLASDKTGDAAEQQALTWLNALTDQATKDRALSALLYAFRSSPRQALANLPAATASAGGRTLLVRAIGPHDPQAKRLDQLCNLALTSGTPRDLLETVQALARMPSAANAAWLLRLLPRAPKDDVYFDFALRGSLAALSKPLLDALETGGLAALNDPQVSEAAVVMALQMLPPDRVGKAVGGLLNAPDRNLASDSLGPLVAHAGDAKAVARLFATLGSPAAAGREANVLRWCGDAAARGVVVSDEKPPLVSLLAHADAGIRAQAIRLAGLWKRADLAPTIRASAADAAVRKEALAALQAIGGERAVTELKTLLTEATDASVRAEALAVLAKVDGAQAIAAATPLLKSAATDNEAAALWRALWGGNGVIERVAKEGLPAELPASTIAGGVTTAKELGGRGTKLLELFKAGQPAAAAAPVHAGDKPVDLPGWVTLTMRDGIPAKGEARYFGLNCMTCHAIGGAGGKLGPDLSTLGASAPLDYIIESVLKPADKVKEGYHSVAFKLKDGSQVIGIPAGETDKEIIVRMPGLEQAVAKDAIVSREITSGSLMPAGLTDVIPAEDQAHLFAFLSQIGKPGPFDASDGKVARVLRLSGSLPEGVAPDLSKMPPAYANIDGRMVPRGWRAPLAAVDGTGAVYAMAQVDVPVAGLLTITIDGQTRPWLDGIRLDPQEAGRMVAAGRHTIAVSVDREKQPKDLRIRVSAGRFVTP